MYYIKLESASGGMHICIHVYFLRDKEKKGFFVHRGMK